MRNIWGNIKTWNMVNAEETSLMTKRKDKQEGGSYQNAILIWLAGRRDTLPPDL